MLRNNYEQLVAQYYTDCEGNPQSVHIIKKYQVSASNGTIILDGIPDMNNNVEVKDATGQILQRVWNVDEVDVNSYYVWSNGRISLDMSRNGTIVFADYYSVGLELLSADRVFTTLDDKGNVIETLEEVLEKGQESIKELEIMGGIYNANKILESNIESSKNMDTQLENTIKTGDSLDNDLKNNINIATDKDNTLKATISDSVNKNNTLNNTINDSVNKDNELKATISDSVNKDNELKNTINDSINKDNQLKATINDSVAKDSNLKGTINSANDINAKLLENSNEVLSTLKGLKIGGTNLLRGTQWFDYGWGRSDGSSVKIDRNNLFEGCAVQVQWDNWNYFYQDVNYEVGESYTLSCYAKTDAQGAKLYFSVAEDKIAWGMQQLTNEWKKYYLTFTANKATGQLRVESGCDNDNWNGGHVYISQMKLEKGTIATDWCSNSLDYETQIGNGENLLALTGYPLSLNNFESNSGKIDIVKSKYAPFTQDVYCIMNDQDSERLAFWTMLDFPINEETHITESCYMYIDENVVSAELFCLAFDEIGNMVYAQPTAFDTKGKWFKAINTVNINDTRIKKIQFRIDNNGVTDGKSGGVYFFYPKLEKGVIATDWSSNPLDWKKQIGNGVNLISSSNCALTADRIAFPTRLKSNTMYTLNMGNIEYDGACLNIYRTSDDYTKNETKPLQTVLDWGNIKGIYTFETNSIIPDNEDLYFVFWGSGINNKYPNSNKKIKLEEGIIATSYCDDVNIKLDKATINNAPLDHDCNSFTQPNSSFMWDTGLDGFRSTPLGDLTQGSGIVFEVVNFGNDGRIQQEFRQTYPYNETRKWIRSYTSDSNGVWSDWRPEFIGDREINSNDDFNNITNMGCYKVQGATGTTPNSPQQKLNSGIYNYGLLTVYESGVAKEHRVLQIYYPHQEGMIGHKTPVIRMKNSTEWTNWTYIGATPTEISSIKKDINSHSDQISSCKNDINTNTKQIASNSSSINDLYGWVNRDIGMQYISGATSLTLQPNWSYYLDGQHVADITHIDHSAIRAGEKVYFYVASGDPLAHIVFRRQGLCNQDVRVWLPCGQDFWIVGDKDGDRIFTLMKIGDAMRFLN